MKTNRTATTATTATTIIKQQGGGSGGAATPGTQSPHGTATSTPHGTSGSNPHGTATSTQAATTTTRLNTIKPLPGRPVAPYFSSPDYTYLTPNHPKTDAYGEKLGVCGGTPPETVATLTWFTSNTDFVEINRGSTNYPANYLDYNFVIQCPDRQVTSLFLVFVNLTAFGPGGEVTRQLSFPVDPNYLP